MKDLLNTMKDPAFWKYMIIAGGLVIAFNLIRLIVVACKIKKAKPFLYHSAEAFNGISIGCGIIAIAGFLRGMQIVGIIATVLAVIFFFCDQKYTWIRHNAVQEAQDILDSTEGQQSTPNHEIAYESDNDTKPLNGRE